MRQRALDSRRPSIETCTFQLQTWKPFHHQLQPTPRNPTESDPTSKPYTNAVLTKRPCLSDRATSFSIDAIDISKLTLFDDERSISSTIPNSLRWIHRKRRRRGSRSISGRSSDRSGTRRCCSVGASAAYGTCSDFPVAVGTDSSGELFLNGDANWSSDVSEAAKNVRKERDGGPGERESLSNGCVQMGNLDIQGNESGYGSEPGYRGDAEFGDGDEVDEEDDDQRPLFWGGIGGTSNMEMVGENSLQKAHYRGRRKKHDTRMVDSFQ